MAASVNWAAPVYGNDVQTSEAYLQRLQDFLAMQAGDNKNDRSSDKDKDKGANSTTTTTTNKRKVNASNGPENDENQSPGAIKDRRQSNEMEDERGIHSHERSTSPPESASSTTKGNKGSKGSTSEKRKEQNRNAQRAFRERKERILKDLEERIEGLNKVNEETVAENQNLKELVSRLQEENKRLQESRKQAQTSDVSAPQSDFTFNVPRAGSNNTPTTANTTATSGGTTPANLNSLPNHLPTTYNDADIMSFLSTAPSASETQQYQQTAEPFHFIGGGSTGAGQQQQQQQRQPELLIPSSIPTLPDDWLWNSSAFGTEIPQAKPPTVFNLMELFGGNLDGSVASNLTSPQNPFASPSPQQQQQLQQRQQQQQQQPQTANDMTGMFGPGASLGGPTRSFSPDDAYNALLSTFAQSPASNSSTDSPNNLNQIEAHRSASFSSTGATTNNLVKQFVNREGSSTKGDSPDTTCSSTGSDPSDAQPSTPNSGFLAGTSAANTKTGFPYASSANQLQGLSLNHHHGSSSNNNNNGSSTASRSEGNTPSSVLNSLPHSSSSHNNSALFGNSLDGIMSNPAFGSNDIDFQALMSGNSYTLSPNEKMSEIMDFNDFLVASPSGMNNASPGTYFGDNNGGHASSSQNSNTQANNKRSPPQASSNSSVPTLSSLSDTTSSSGSSPASIPSGNANSSHAHGGGLSSSSTTTTDFSALNCLMNTSNGPIVPQNIFLPSDIKYSNPFIQHILSDKWVPKGDAAGSSNQPPIPGPPADLDIDGLCKDMVMKASCQEVARERLARAMQTDETALKLYDEYILKAKQETGTELSNQQIESIANRVLQSK